ATSTRNPRWASTAPATLAARSRPSTTTSKKSAAMALFAHDRQPALLEPLGEPPLAVFQPVRSVHLGDAARRATLLEQRARRAGFAGPQIGQPRAFRQLARHVAAVLVFGDFAVENDGRPRHAEARQHLRAHRQDLG